MAKPISLVKKREFTEAEKKAQKLDKLADHVSDSDEALNQSLRILAELHESGILEGLESLLKAKGKVTEILLGQVGRPEMTNMINNVMGAASALSAIDSEHTNKLLSGLANGLTDANHELKSGKKVSAFGLLKALRDPDVNRAVGFGLSFMKGLGKSLK